MEDGVWRPCLRIEWRCEQRGEEGCNRADTHG
jgi:hypothetical protein